MSGFRQHKGFVQHRNESWYANHAADDVNKQSDEDYILMHEKFDDNVKYNVPFEQRYVVDDLRREDKDNLSITKDCEIDNVLFNKIVVSGDLNAGRNYLSLYKVLKKVGYTNKEINKIINSNLFWLYNFRIDNLEYVDKVLEILGEDKNDITKLLNALFRYSKIKKLLNKFKLAKDLEANLLESYILKNQDKIADEEEIKGYRVLNENSSILNTVVEAQKVNKEDFIVSFIVNIELLKKLNKNTLISYLSILNLAELDFAVLNGNINVIAELMAEEIYPSVLYRYVREGMNQKRGNLMTLDTLHIIIDNYSYETLKNKYPITIDEASKKTTLDFIKKAYIMDLNAKVMLMKTKDGESRK